MILSFNFSFQVPNDQILIPSSKMLVQVEDRWCEPKLQQGQNPNFLSLQEVLYPPLPTPRKRYPEASTWPSVLPSQESLSLHSSDFWIKV
jgi:hypothetical protein